MRISNENIKYQLSSNRLFENAMNIESFLCDGIIFSSGFELSNKDWTKQWIKYCRVIMKHSGYRVEYINPYKSNKLKEVVEYSIYKENEFIIGCQTSGLENAEVQAYIRILELSSFNESNLKIDEIKWILDKIERPTYNQSTYTDRHYRIHDDLNKILDNKLLLREWKLSLILNKNEKI